MPKLSITAASKRTNGWHTPFPNGVTCYEVGGEFYVYEGARLERVVPSIGMARSVAASLEG